MAEIVVSRSGGKDQPVIALPGPGAGFDDLRLRIDRNYLVEQYRRIALMAEDDPDRFGDIGR